MSSTLSFSKNSKACEVTLHASSVQVSYLKKNNKQVTVDISYGSLLTTELRHHQSKSKRSDKSSVVVLHYVSPVINRRLPVNTLAVQADLATCNMLVKALNEELTAAVRPKKLAVIINPNSGKKQAEKVFSNKVQPLFKLCGIQTHVVVTNAPKNARDVLQTLDLEGVEGVVAVGGDGLYCEVMNGLIMRTQADSGVDVDDPEARVVRSQVPIGIIPAGTGDMVLQYLHGTRDVMTAALRVVLGATRPSNAVSVHQGGRLSAYSGLVLGFGLQGDMMDDCERFRWMGHLRYSVIPIGTVLGRHSYHLEVEYEDQDSLETKRTSDVMYSVDTYVVSKQEKEEKLQPLFGADCLEVFMTSKCPLSKHVQQLTKFKDNEPTAFDYDFVRRARVQGYTVRLPSAPCTTQNGQEVLTEKYNVNCDGEVLKISHPEFHVRLHHHAVRVFGEAIV